MEDPPPEVSLQSLLETGAISAEDFAAAVVGLREYIADGEKEEGAEPDRFYDERVGPLALETLSLWVDRLRGQSKGPKGEKLAGSRAPNVLDKASQHVFLPLLPSSRLSSLRVT